MLLTRSPRPLHESPRSEEHTSELQSQSNLVCRLLLEKKKITLPRSSYGDRSSLRHAEYDFCAVHFGDRGSFRCSYVGPVRKRLTSILLFSVIYLASRS